MISRLRKPLALFSIAVSLNLYGIVANPTPAVITQPDGSTVEITLHGDEYFSLTTTTEGYTVVKDTDGYYKYALVKNDSLVASQVVAHSFKNRGTVEKKYLSSIEKYIFPQARRGAAIERRAQVINTESPLLTSVYDYNNFRGLVILVEFNDCKFSRDDISTIFKDMITKSDYTGFLSENGEKNEYTGSVRDYFYSNSMGKFDPKFDVYGPVTIDCSQTSPNGADNRQIYIPAAIKAAESIIDYSKYDTDGDKVVDMIYFIFAGAGANYAGNNSKYIWPHAANVPSSMSLDGVKFGRYACSTEFYGLEKYKIIDGIGTICHEFSHVLGLPDLYDTDYSTNGLSSTPEDWSVMAGGCYLNFGRTPCCFSLYERYAVGFAKPQTLEQDGSYTLKNIGHSNAGYRIDSQIPKEFFLIENRQKEGWDKHLPGHGMLVFRVDSTNSTVWEKNQVNAYANRNYYELLRACPTKNNNKIIDSDGDTFPGSGGVTELTNTTSPSLRSWTGMETNLVLTNIQELENGDISFRVEKDEPDHILETFEKCQVTDGSKMTIEGDVSQWLLDGGAKIESVENINDGKLSVALIMGSSITSGIIEGAVDFIKAEFYNPTYYQTVISCQYSSDNGDTWVKLNTINGDSEVRLTSKTNANVIFKAQTPRGCMYRFTETVGNRTSYLDNIDFLLTKDTGSSAVTPILGTQKTSIKVESNGSELTIFTQSDDIVSIYSIDGKTVANTVPSNGQVTVKLPSRGFYIIRQNNETIRFLY